MTPPDERARKAEPFNPPFRVEEREMPRDGYARVCDADGMLIAALQVKKAQWLCDRLNAAQPTEKAELTADLEAMIERGAEVLAGGYWHQLNATGREVYRQKARAVLKAVGFK